MQNIPVKIISILFWIVAILIILSFVIESVPVFIEGEYKITNRIKDDNDIKVAILKEEIRFRTKVFQNMNDILRLNTQNNDSISYQKLPSSYSQFLLLQKIDSTYFQENIAIPISNPLKYYDWFNTYFFTSFTNIDVSLLVNKDNLKNLILNEFESENFTDLLRYGTFIDTKLEIKPEFNYNHMFFIGGPAILFFFIMFFWISNTKRNIRNSVSDISLDEAEKELTKFEKLKEEVLASDFWKSLTDESIPEMEEQKEKMDEMSEVIKKLKNKITSFSEISDIKKALIYEVKKIERDTQDLFNRSTLMLVIGLGVATLGIIIFYISLPDTNILVFENLLSKSLRPIFILIFIESIAFYMLKQYRISMQDYKYFHQKYENRISQKLMFDILNDPEPNDKMKTLIGNLSKDSHIIDNTKELDLELTKIKPALNEIISKIISESNVLKKKK